MSLTSLFFADYRLWQDIDKRILPGAIIDNLRRTVYLKEPLQHRARSKMFQVALDLVKSRAKRFWRCKYG